MEKRFDGPKSVGQWCPFMSLPDRQGTYGHLFAGLDEAAADLLSKLGTSCMPGRGTARSLTIAAT